MNDLISRQAVIDLLKKNTTRDIEEVVVTEKNIKLIMDMPKAYDVEKVVEELKNESDYEPIDYDYYDMPCTDEQYFIATDTAIDIVKKGGVE